ncbi:MAG: hemerythrin domain-containing protein [Actinomycetes bacterium]|jgi:hemerythrin-like domain-containing protein
MDALTLVREEHRRLEELLGRCERPEGDGGPDREVLRQFQGAVRHHVDQEESILYPIFRERARQAEVDLASLDRAVEQHRLIDRLAGELTGPAPDGAAHKAKLTVLAEQVRNHLDDEDSVLLTAIEDLIDDDTLLELGRRMEQRDRVIAARRELAATLVPGDTRSRRLAALGGLAALGSALLAILAHRRRQPPRRRSGRRRRRR